MKNVFGHRNFLFLWLAQTIEQFGDSLVIMSLIAWAMSMRENGTSAGNMSILMLWIGIPIVLIGPIAGVFVDRIGKKPMMAVTAAARGICIFIMYVLIGNKARGAFVYMMVFMISSISQFFITAKSTFIPKLVPRNDLLDANAACATAIIVTQILTYAIGGVLISKIGHQKALFIGSCVYAIVVLMMFFIRIKEKIAPNKAKETVADVWNDFTDGIRFLVKNDRIMFMVRRVFVLVVAAGFFYVSLTGNFLEIILRETGSRMKDIKALGFMQAFLGVGLVAGMFFTSHLLKWFKETTLIRSIFPVMGILIVTLYYIRDFYYLLLLAVAGGIAGVVIISLAETEIQKNTPEKLRGRLFAAYYILRSAGLAFASAFVGVMTKAIKEEQIILFTGIGMVAYGILNIIMISLRKSALD
jgi:MFS transporter, DHA3 family, macrolide efflux protein